MTNKLNSIQRSKETDVVRPADTTSRAMPSPYKLAQVEKVDAPNGGQGEDWYRYVLNNGRSTITGRRRGSRKTVTRYANQCAEQLNTRGLTAQSIWSPRGRKPASTT
jgi:hypothetical protein